MLDCHQLIQQVANSSAGLGENLQEIAQIPKEVVDEIVQQASTEEVVVPQIADISTSTIQGDFQECNDVGSQVNDRGNLSSCPDLHYCAAL